MCLLGIRRERERVIERDGVLLLFCNNRHCIVEHLMFNCIKPLPHNVFNADEKAIQQ